MPATIEAASDGANFPSLAERMACETDPTTRSKPTSGERVHKRPCRAASFKSSAKRKRAAPDTSGKVHIPRAAIAPHAGSPNARSMTAVQAMAIRSRGSARLLVTGSKDWANSPVRSFASAAQSSSRLWKCA